MQILIQADARERAARAHRRNNPRNLPRGDREQAQHITYEDLYEHIRRNREAFRAHQIREQAAFERMVQEREDERRREDEQWAAERRQQEQQEAAARAAAEADAASRAAIRRGVFVVEMLFWLGLVLVVGCGLYLPKDGKMTAQPAPGSELAVYKIKPEEVIANAFKDLFVSHAGIIEKAMTPSSLNEVQGRAFFDLSTEEEEDCCAIDDALCRLSAVAPKYVPAFLQPYLFEQIKNPTSTAV